MCANIWKQKTRYWFLSRILNDDKTGAWFQAENFNGVFYHDFASEEVRLIGSLPIEEKRNSISWKGIKFKDKLYFPDRRSRSLFVYDLKKNVSTRKILPSFTQIPEEDAVYIGFNTAVFDNELFLMSRDFPVSYAVKEDGKITVIMGEESCQRQIASGDYLIDGEELITPVLDENSFLVLNMRTRRLKKIYFLEKSARFISLTKSCDGTLYLLRMDKPSIYSFKRMTGDFTVLVDLPNVECNLEQPLSIFFFDSKLYIVPFFDWKGSSITTWVVEVEDKRVHKKRSFAEYESMLKFSGYRDGSHIGYFFAPREENINNNHNMIYADYDVILDSFVERYLPFPKNVEESVFLSMIEDYQHDIADERIGRSNGILVEAIGGSEQMSLQDFINFIKE